MLTSLGRERRIDAQIDELIAVARNLPPELKDAVAGSARETLMDGRSLTRDEARTEIPAALDALERERTADNVERALVFATMTRTPEPLDLLRLIHLSDANESAQLVDAGRSRAKRYPSHSSRCALYRDLVHASVELVVSPCPSTRREALILAQALATKDAADIQTRTPEERWRAVADDVVARVAKKSSP